MDKHRLQQILSMEIPIITHKDWDGLCSAALLKGVMNKELGIRIKDNRILFSQPNQILDESKVQIFDRARGRGITRPLSDRAFVMLDLPFKYGTKLWIDHHEGHSLPKNELRGCDLYYFDETCQSAVQLLARLFLKEYNLRISEEIVSFSDRFDSGTLGKQYELEDLDSIPPINKLGYIVEFFNTMEDFPVLFHIINLIAANYEDLESINDPLIDSYYRKVIDQRKKGRELIKDSEYYKRLLIIDLSNRDGPFTIANRDITPLFHQYIKKERNIRDDSVLGYFLIRHPNKGRISARLALIWWFDERLVRLQNDKRLNIRHIGQSFGGEGHFDVVGFIFAETEKSKVLNKIKSDWDALLKNWEIED